MGDFVEREKIQEVISDIYKDADSAVEGACIEIWSRVKEIPAANVRPVVRGKWVLWMRIPEDYVCDKCEWHSRIKTHFCPNCGADMREES